MLPVLRPHSSMPRPMTDQAEGLRRLRGLSGVNVIAVVAGHRGTGRTTLIAELAVALARNGRTVMIVDENLHDHGIAARFGLRVRHDLLHVVRGGRALDEAILQARPGIAVLPAGQAAGLGPASSAAWEELVIARLAQFGELPQIVLAEAPTAGASRIFDPGAAAHDVLVVACATAFSITHTYGLIKFLNREHARRHFLVVMNKVARERDANLLFRNLSRAARQHLSAVLELVGVIPLDKGLQRSLGTNRAVVEAAPESAAGQAFNAVAERVLCRMAEPGGHRDGATARRQRLPQYAQVGFPRVTGS